MGSFHVFFYLFVGSILKSTDALEAIGLDQLKKECEARNAVWITYTLTCMENVAAKHSWEEALSSCESTAPIGARGRLMFIKNSLTHSVIKNLGFNDHWIGFKLASHVSLPANTNFDVEEWVWYERIHSVVHESSMTWKPKNSAADGYGFLIIFGLPKYGRTAACSLQDCIGEIIFQDGRASYRHQSLCEYVADSITTRQTECIPSLTNELTFMSDWPNDWEETACDNVNGVSVKHNCFYLAHSDTAFEWSQIFETCREYGNGTPVHLYSSDTAKLMHAWIFKNYADTPYWTALKLTYSGSAEEARLMLSPTEKGSIHMGNFSRPDYIPAGTEVCQIEVMESCTKSSNPSVLYSTPIVTQYFTNCTGGIQVHDVICMKDTRGKADFITMENQRMQVDRALVLGMMEASSTWFCGLYCRRKPGCVSYNYNPESQECELLAIKASKGSFCVKWGDAGHCYTITVEENPKWTYNEREN